LPCVFAVGCPPSGEDVWDASVELWADGPEEPPGIGDWPTLPTDDPAEILAADAVSEPDRFWFEDGLFGSFFC
jgi:hypothetical protein